MPVAPAPGMSTPTIQTPQNEFFPPDMEDTDGSPMAKARDQNMIWRSYPAEVPMNLGGQLSTYADPATASAAWADSNFGPGNEMGWNSNMPPPPRSMSFSGEILGSQRQPQYYLVPQQNQIYDNQQQHFTHIYGGVPVDESDEVMDQAIDPAIMGTAVPSVAPMAWQQQQQQQQQQLMARHQQHQMPDTRVGIVYREWGEYGEGDGTHHM
ncbi:Zn2Cys6 transcriptional regulator [Trichoderma cornu-damae]|uniref:Zn2Cys6 transcriptional regulator n=1 Tax=Trichoderma cornu-damae TaxID=654480 RepID=A0A9P8QU02_9HYPO|nr:Zn2Cys6 transcriptional regulator [Trichoderma cornu-damae]